MFESVLIKMDANICWHRDDTLCVCACVPGMQQASELVTALNDFARGDEQIILADVSFGRIDT